jgi:NUC153 domain
VKLTWDQDDPERDRVTRRALSLKEIEDNDFHAYIASSSSSEDGTELMKKKKCIDRNELRTLLLGGGSNDLPEGWAGSKAVELDKNGGDVDMEVTFRPALSGGNDEDETTLGRYQRKMREKRKKRKRDLKDKIKDKSLADDFFAPSEGEEDSDGMPMSARRAVEVEQRGATHKPSTKEELALLVAPDQPDSERQHFDLTAIIKAEKSEGRRRKGRKKKTGGDDDNELQDDFTIDVKDERFRALHEDYAFAIDPSNPR